MRGVLLVWMVCLLGVSGLSAEPNALTREQIEGTRRQTDAASFRMTFHPPSRIEINHYQTWGIYIEDATGKALSHAVLKVDANMPAHGHGLLTQPRIAPGDAPGRYRVEGLRFHMPGHWEIRLQVNHAGKQDALVLPVELE